MRHKNLPAHLRIYPDAFVVCGVKICEMVCPGKFLPALVNSPLGVKNDPIHIKNHGSYFVKMDCLLFHRDFTNLITVFSEFFFAGQKRVVEWTPCNILYLFKSKCERRFVLFLYIIP